MIDFIRKRKIWYALSTVIILIGLIAVFVNGLNYGVDFRGGSLLHFKFQDTVATEQLRTALGDLGLEDVNIQESTDNTHIVKTVELTEEREQEITTGLSEKLGQFDLLRSEKVGPVIGSELRNAALLALLVASVLQIIYITIRFEFKFAISAILGLLHDVLVAVGFFAIFQLEVDSTFVAAILTIIGYSINDTIVIFDRIRENLRNRKKEDLADLINKSVNQTIVRSLITGVSVIIVLIALLFLGGETTKNFSLALLVGVLCGTYSSIFFCSPLLYDLKPEEHRKGKAAKA